MNIPYSMMQRIERRSLERSTHKLQYPPLFILGPPRSGTTLLYQLMIHRFELSYFTNIADLLNKIPVMATRWGRRLSKPYESSFESNYGRVAGPLAPSEAGGIWNRWFPYEDRDGFNYVDENYLSAAEQHLIRETVACIEKIMHAPFVNKNVKHSVRIHALNQIFPHALFVFVERDPQETAVSILHGRRMRSEDVNAWWSAMPKEIDQLRGKSALEQIAGQVFYLEQNAANDLAALSGNRSMSVKYADLCEKPRVVMDEIGQLVFKQGCELRTRADVPESFEQSSQSNKDVTERERAELNRLLSEYSQGDAVSG